MAQHRSALPRSPFMRRWFKWFRRRRNRRPGSEYRRAADKARDAKDWARAETAYAAYLRLNPEAGGVWVQRGHCLKEDGDLVGAERCYRRAIDIDPRQGDPLVHLADVVKRSNRATLAIEYLTRAAILGEHQAIVDLERFFTMTPDEVQRAGRSITPWITTDAAAHMLAEAQALRDRRQWSKAEQAYVAYIAARPGVEQVNRELDFVRDMATR